jgi:hypothetical protein
MDFPLKRLIGLNLPPQIVEYKLNKHITQQFQKCKTKKLSTKDDRKPKSTFHQNSPNPKYGVEPTNATKSHGLC